MELKKRKCFDYDVERKGGEINLVIYTLACNFYPSLEGSEETMEKTFKILLETGPVTQITYIAERNYVYPYKNVKALNEIASLYIYLVRDKDVLSPSVIGIEKYAEKVSLLKDFLLRLFRDPIGAYVYLKREGREIKVKAKKDKDYEKFSEVIDEILDKFEETTFYKFAEDELPGYKVGDRNIYFKFFEPSIRPNFMYTRLMLSQPVDSEEVDVYEIGKGNLKSSVSILRVPGKVRMIYHVTPPEFTLSGDEYAILDEAREVLAKYKPSQEEFVSPDRMREVFFNIAKDLIGEVCKRHKVKLSYENIVKLAKILVRLTVGFGIVEVLLQDKKIEDIYVNAPVGTTPVFVKHADYGELETNIIPNYKDAESWASRFRMISRRPLDEANPVLDTEIEIPEVARARTAIIQNPLSPNGYSFAFRQHRPKPWTLPLFIANKTLTPLAAGLLSFLVDGARTMLIAGTRGSGKTSLLSSLMVEIMRKYRIITVEDTLELPGDYLRNIGFNIVPMKVRSAIVGEKTELSATEGIRTTLRLGDSALIVGEVRSKEAIALYEAMRVGALANVVAGTIHGDSPYGVFDRIVNDLGVPRTSFKATDIIVIAGKIRTPAQLKEIRRTTFITEVRKTWEEDPLRENGFLDLMKYNAAKDEIEPTRELMEGESEVIKSIASNVREWYGKWDRVWDNILLRAEVKKMLVDYAKKLNRPEILEADFVVEANDMFHRIFEELREEIGYPENKDVLSAYERWLKRRLKKKW